MSRNQSARKDRRAGPPRLALGLGQGAGLQSRAPKSSYLSPGQRAKARLLRGPLPDTEEAGLGSCHGSFFGLWNSRRGQLGPARSPLREGTAGECGIWAIGVSEMTDADIVWPLIRGSRTMRWARAVSLSCFQCCKWASHPTIQTDPASYLEERSCGVQDGDLGQVWGQAQPVTQPTPGPWSPQGSGVGVLLVPSDEAQLTGPGVGAGSAPSSAP